MVFVRRDAVAPPLTPPYEGPYTVLKRFRKFFLIQRGSVRDKVSVDRLKPALLPVDAAPGLPPRRGRPRLPVHGQTEGGSTVTTSSIARIV